MYKICTIIALKVHVCFILILISQQYNFYMRYKPYNPNPNSNKVGDCVIRALTLALDLDWDSAYLRLVMQGLCLKDMPSSNNVWGSLLKRYGYKVHVIPNNCPDCYTVTKFCIDHSSGTYVLGTGSHVVTVIDGFYYDSWDSGDEVPIYYFSKED